MTTVNNFQTPNPVKLYVELMSGEVKLDAVETDETTVTIDGRNVDDVVVTQQGDEISIIGPKVRGLFNFDRGYDVKVTLPLDSQFILKGGSTDITESASTLNTTPPATSTRPCGATSPRRT